MGVFQIVAALFRIALQATNDKQKKHPPAPVCSASEKDRLIFIGTFKGESFPKVPP